MGKISHVVTILVISLIIVIGLAFYSDRKQNISQPLDNINEDSTLESPLTPEEQIINKQNIENPMNPIAIFTTSMGEIRLELFEDKMPITVGNFVSLAESGFYDGIKFHRVISNFMIQAGDPNTKNDNEALYGQGGPGKNIQDEFVEDDILTNVRGTIAMANTGQPNSGGSQFFINLGDNTGLDFNKPPFTSKHPVFGRVIEGMDVVDEIAGVETKERDIPVIPVVVESVVIERVQ